MASLRSGMLTRRIAGAPLASRLRPLTSLPLRRFYASEKRAPYEKGENVGEKKFSQFDVDGKVFVVTGAAARRVSPSERVFAP